LIPYLTKHKQRQRNPQATAYITRTC